MDYMTFLEFQRVCKDDTFQIITGNDATPHPDKYH